MNYEFKDYLLDFFDLGYEMLPCATLEFDRNVVVYFEKSEPFTFPIES